MSTKQTLECEHPEERQLKLGQYKKKDIIKSVMACDVCSYQYELTAMGWWK